MDDESYFTLTGSGMPGNRGFYSSSPNMAPDDIRLCYEEKKPVKVMLLAVISARGVGKIYISHEHQTMTSDIYTKQCFTRVLNFIVSHYESREDVVFWPDLATSQYAAILQEYMKDNNLSYVPKYSNPPAAPQIRPIQIFGPF